MVRKPEMDAPPLQSMEGHLQTSMEVWVDNNNSKIMKYNRRHRELNYVPKITILWPYLQTNLTGIAKMNTD